MRELSAECRLVFGSAHVTPDMQAIEECLRQPLDWARIVAIAETERATPVLWRVLGRADGSLVPAVVADRLRGSAMVYDFRMRRLESRLAQTVAVLRDRGIPVLLLKGAALAVSEFGGFTERPMSDIDLLVRRDDVGRARQAIIDSGWPETTDPRLLDLLKDEHHLPPFGDPEPTGLRVELHRAFLPVDHPFAFDEDDLWRGASSAEAAFAGALIASREHLLFHAALHFSWSHTMRFGAWRTFRDASALTSHAEFDWDLLLDLAARTKAGTSCYWTLLLAKRMSGVRVPPSVIERLSPPTPEPVMRALERHLVAGIAAGEGPQCPSSRLEHLLWRAALRPRWSGHTHQGRWDPQHRWARAFGVVSQESASGKLTRHAKGVRRWWRFVTRTLAPFD